MQEERVKELNTFPFNRRKEYCSTSFASLMELGFELRASTSSHSISTFFMMGLLEVGVGRISLTVSLGWLQTTVL
jgi:hypothetical protein